MEEDFAKALTFGLIIGLLIGILMMWLIMSNSYQRLDINGDNRITMTDAMAFEELRNEVIECLPIANPSSASEIG